MSTPVNELHIARPKKSDGTFICAIKSPFLLEIQGTLVHTKDTNDGAQFAFFKCSKATPYDYIYDLNTEIISQVKSNCSTWFNTNMNPELIDDYYTATLIYDKTHGDLIKLKVFGEELFTSDMLGANLNVKLDAKQLRFYKQKFVLETEIESYEVANELIEFSEEEEEEAYPSPMELKEMKAELLAFYDNKLEEVAAQLAALDAKGVALTEKKQAIENADTDTVLSAYNEYHVTIDA
jgi:hypothetical protein